MKESRSVHYFGSNHHKLVLWYSEHLNVNSILFYFLSSYYLVTSCYVEDTPSSLYSLEQWIMCSGFQICLCLPPLPSSFLPVSISSHHSVPSLSLSFTLWRRVSNRIGGYSTPSPTNNRNPSLEDMMPTILNSSIFYLTSTHIKLSKGHTFIWMLWIRSNSGPFITYMVWLWFEFASVNYSNKIYFASSVFLEVIWSVGSKPNSLLYLMLSYRINHPSLLPTTCLQRVCFRTFGSLVSCSPSPYLVQYLRVN